MHQRDLNQNEIVAYCDHCRCDTVHEVSLRLESTTEETEVTSQNLKFAKSPARQTMCTNCGTDNHHPRCAYH
ncbi:DUF7835 family putative zinc beta-ribbon protein [Halegenticoccus tardaugens]